MKAIMVADVGLLFSLKNAEFSGGKPFALNFLLPSKIAGFASKKLFESSQTLAVEVS